MEIFAVVNKTSPLLFQEKSDYSINANFVDLDLGSPYDYVLVNAGGSRSSPSLGIFRKGSPLGKNVLKHVIL